MAATMKEAREGNARTCPGKRRGRGRRVYEGGRATMRKWYEA